MEEYDNLFDAVQYGSLPDVKRLIAAGEDVNERDISDSTPIFKVEEGDIAKALIDAGAEIHATDEDGFTPLHSARQNESVARVLVDAGANISAKNRGGVVPIQLASFEVTKLLIESGADVNAIDDHGFTPLHFAADVDVAEALIGAGAKIHIKNNWGETASEWHNARRHLDIARVIEAHAIKVEQAKLQTTTPAAQPQPTKRKVKAYI